MNRTPKNELSSRVKERISQTRGIISEKMGRYISSQTYDSKLTQVNLEDFDDNPQKYDQDVAFESYAPNLQESHYMKEREVRDYYKDKAVYNIRRMGAYAMYLPGMNYIEGLYVDMKHERELQKNRRKEYKLEHGTFSSNMKKQWLSTSKRIANLESTTGARLKVRKSRLN